MSYMCQCQLSGSSLPSAADTPPCAATVCERVGNTLESTATRRFACASPSAARMPGAAGADDDRVELSRCYRHRQYNAPEDLPRPHAVGDEREDHEHVQHEPQPRVLHVIHEDVAHADPRVQQRAQRRRRSSRSA